MQEQGILAVSFGTSYPETRAKTIQALEQDLCARFPERRFYRAWTSGIIRRKLEKQGEHIDSVDEALERIAADGIRDLLVQTTHMLVGEEHALTLAALEKHKSAFSSLSFGAPLLANEQDVDRLAVILERSFPDTNAENLLVFMGHGSEHLDYPVYEALENRLHRDGFTNYCVGTVEFTPGFGPILERVRREKPKKVILAPLMVVAGDHAINDMAGDDPGSWRSQLQALGLETECILRGLGEYPEIRQMYVQHAAAAVPLSL